MYMTFITELYIEWKVMNRSRYRQTKTIRYSSWVLILIPTAFLEETRLVMRKIIDMTCIMSPASWKMFMATMLLIWQTFESYVNISKQMLCYSVGHVKPDKKMDALGQLLSVV